MSETVLTRKFIIDKAAIEDVPTIVAIASLIHDETPYHKFITIDPIALTETISFLIQQETSLVVTAKTEEDDRIIGAIGALSHLSPISGELGVGEAFWWVHPEFRSGYGFSSPGLLLLRVIEHWAKELGAKWIQLTAPTQEIGDSFAAMGYELMERNYQKRVDPC